MRRVWQTNAVILETDRRGWSVGADGDCDADGLTDGVWVQCAAGRAMCSGPGRGDDTRSQPAHRLHQLPAAEARRRHRQHTGARQQPGTRCVVVSWPVGEGNLHPHCPPREYLNEYTSQGKPKIPPADRIVIDPGHKARKNPSDNADLGFQAVGPALHMMQLNVDVCQQQNTASYSHDQQVSVGVVCIDPQFTLTVRQSPVTTWYLLPMQQ